MGAQSTSAHQAPRVAHARAALEVAGATEEGVFLDRAAPGVHFG
jgi:hypothetical protein